MMVRIFFICVISSIFISCNKNRETYIPKIYRSIDLDKIGHDKLKQVSITENKNVTNINIACNSVDMKYGLNDLLDSIWYVPLQVTENSIVGEITKIIPVGKNYLIFDQSKAKALFLFDHAGNFLKQIGRPGNGPDEYLEIGDVSVHNNSIIIYDRKKGRLMTFDLKGNFIKAAKVYASFRSFDVLEDQNFVCDVYLDYNVHLPQISNTKLLMCDSNFNLLSTGLLYDPDAVSEYRYFSNRSNLTEVKEGGVLYSPPLTDTIFFIKDAFTISPLYRISFGNCKISEDFKENMKSENFTLALTNSDFAYFLGEAVDTPDFLFLRTYQKQKSQSTYFSKKTGLTKGGGIYIDDNPNSLGFNDPIASKGNVFISYVDAIGIAETIQMFGNNKEFLNSKNKEAIDLGKKIDQGDNPILVFFTLKTF